MTSSSVRVPLLAAHLQPALCLLHALPHTHAVCACSSVLSADSAVQNPVNICCKTLATPVHAEFVWKVTPALAAGNTVVIKVCWGVGVALGFPAVRAFTYQEHTTLSADAASATLRVSASPQFVVEHKVGQLTCAL